jgi:hypothetical protein
VKEAFNDGPKADHQMTLEANITDFDWKRLYRLLNEEAAETEIDPLMVEAIVRLLKMFVRTSKPKIRPDQVGLRVIALAWLLNPAYFADSPSLRQLAKRCGVSHQTLAELTGHYSRVIGWRNPAQRRAWNWRNSDRRT